MQVTMRDRRRCKPSPRVAKIRRFDISTLKNCFVAVSVVSGREIFPLKNHPCYLCYFNDEIFLLKHCHCHFHRFKPAEIFLLKNFLRHFPSF